MPDMTLAEKIDALRFASFSVGYADPARAYEKGYLSWSDIESYPFDGGMPVVELCGIAKGEDRCDQSTTVDRSNFRSLLRDYGQALLPLSYSNVDTLALFPHSVSDDLVNTVVSLSVEYPLYDESDHSDLEWEEIHESFDAYLWSDLWDDLSPEARDLAALFESDEIRDAFYAAMSDQQVFPEHDGLDILWRSIDVVGLMEAALFTLAASIVPADTAPVMF